MPGLYFDCEHTYGSGFRLALQFETSASVTALVGPSGSGKTTILRLIAGLLRPRAGSIRFGERVLTDVTGNVHVPPEQRRIALVFQDLCLFPHMNVKQNLEFGLRRSSTQNGSFTELIELLEIAELLSRFPQTLSGGQRQRVALGRALLQNPSLLLLDEPLAALDAPLQQRILTYLKRILDKYQLPTVLVTHDRTHVDALAQSVVEIDRGHVRVPLAEPPAAIVEQMR